MQSANDDVFGLPDDAKFLGFIVASEMEDFLGGVLVNPVGVAAKWMILPDLAKVYKTRKQAEKDIRTLQPDYPVYVLRIFDVGKQVVLLADGEKRPPWM